MMRLIVRDHHWSKLLLPVVCVLLTASIVLTGCSATPVHAPSPPSLDAPATLPVSAYVNLAPYEVFEFHIRKYLAATDGCAHASTAISLSQGESVSLTLESDCPIDWYGEDWDNARPQIGIIFPQMKSLTEDSGWVTICSEAIEERHIMSSNEGKRLEVIFTVHPDNSGASIPNIYRLLAMNFDPDNSHYLKYSISLHTSPLPAPAPIPPVPTPTPAPAPTPTPSPASPPISMNVNLAPYSKIEKLDYPEYSSFTEGCAHVSSAVSLAEGQTITLTIESDCAVNWLGTSSEGEPKSEVCIIFAQMHRVGITSLVAKTVTFFNGGEAAQIVLTAIGTEVPSIYKLLVWNHDPHNSHYLQYSITNGVASPPPGWKPSGPSPITLPRSPSTPEIMKFYITPNDPEVKAALNDILSGEWRWAYNDFNALREWVSTHVSYRHDQDVHGVTEYWQLPAETLKLGTGDCEDFAILLCSLLRAYGVPPDQVYVACGFGEDKTHGHAYLVEKWYKGIWRVIEPEAGELTGEFIMDWWTSVSFKEWRCFNDQDCFKGHPTLPPGVYESWVDYSLWPMSRGASVTFERHLNAGQKVSGSVEWLADRVWVKEGYQIAYDWSLYIYVPDGSTAFSWSGTDLEHDFNFKPTASGTYKIEILKRDYRARGVRLTIDPPDWQ